MKKEDLENAELTKHNERHGKQEEMANNLSLIKFITEQERKMKRKAARKPGLLRATTVRFVFFFFL